MDNRFWARMWISLAKQAAKKEIGVWLRSIASRANSRYEAFSPGVKLLTIIKGRTIKMGKPDERDYNNYEDYKDDLMDWDINAIIKVSQK